MNKSFQRRLDKAAQGVEMMPESSYTDAENRKWAEQQIVEMMAEFNLTHSEALAQAQEHAPTIAEWLKHGVNG